MPAELRTGSTAPEVISEPSTPVLAWVFRGEDCLACDTPARLLRRVRARFGTQIRTVAVAVDDRRQLAPPFFARERIEAELRPIDQRGYRRSFGRGDLPALYLSADGFVRGIWPGRSSSQPDDTLRAEGHPVIRAIEMLLAETPTPVGVDPASPTSRPQYLEGV